MTLPPRFANPLTKRLSGPGYLLFPLLQGIIYRYQRPGRLAQLARASRLHRGGRGFESLSAHHVRVHSDQT
jgi:hypothetical protein